MNLKFEGSAGIKENAARLIKFLRSQFSFYDGSAKYKQILRDVFELEERFEMAEYLEDKMEQAELQGKSERDNIARATLKQLSTRWGVQGGLYWMVEKKAPPKILIKAMGGIEQWELDGDQPGVNYKDKTYKKVS